MTLNRKTLSMRLPSEHLLSSTVTSKLLTFCLAITFTGECSKAYAGVSASVSCADLQSTSKDKLVGYVQNIFEGNGTVVGWALDRNNDERPVILQFYVDDVDGTKGRKIGSAIASTINRQVNWDENVKGNHGFVFRLPNELRDGQEHRLSVYVSSCDSALKIGLTKPVSYFRLSPLTRFTQNFAVSSKCLDTNSRCPSNGPDFLNPNFPVPAGWSDGKDYFNLWKCSSSSGFHHIARLNIIPFGSFGPHFQKDSLDVNWFFDRDQRGNPIVYFTAAHTDEAPRWRLQKAIYNTQASKWEIFSVLDNPFGSGGLSSQDGRGVNIVMNDYAIEGWGPVTPTPPPNNAIPGVSQISLSQDRPVFPLVGKGPLGITAMTMRRYPSSNNGSVSGRTCIHMNPKLLDFDTKGVPRTLLVNLWQGTVRSPCALDDALTTHLPEGGNYLYRYEGEDRGWQLDTGFSVITDGWYAREGFAYRITPKLLAGTAHTLVVATWTGEIEEISLDGLSATNGKVTLDCSKSGMHFGEAAGGEKGIFFLGVDPDPDAVKRRIGMGDDVLPNDVYYVYK